MVRACEICGGPVIIEGNDEGTNWYTPILEKDLNRFMDTRGTDEFIRDRLFRAEKIIINLRQQLNECKDREKSNMGKP